MLLFLLHLFIHSYPFLSADQLTLSHGQVNSGVRFATIPKQRQATANRNSCSFSPSSSCLSPFLSYSSSSSFAVDVVTDTKEEIRRRLQTSRTFDCSHQKAHLNIHPRTPSALHSHSRMNSLLQHLRAFTARSILHAQLSTTCSEVTLLYSHSFSYQPFHGRSLQYTQELQYIPFFYFFLL